MGRWHSLQARARTLLRRDADRRELEEELRYHRDREYERLIARGLTADQAQSDASRSLGDPVRVGEAVRDASGWGWLDDFRHDCRIAVRSLGRTPGFAILVVLTLGLGVGANTAVFGLVRAVLLRPLPYPDADRLVAVVDSRSDGAGGDRPVSLARYLAFNQAAQSWSALAAWRDCSYVTIEQGVARRLFGACVTANFLPMLGVAPALGRTFAPDENRPGAGHVALLSYRYWQLRYGGRSDVVGRVIPQAGGNPAYTIVGVLPRDFQFARDQIDLYLPLSIDPASPYRDQHEWLLFGRLKPVVSLSSARAELHVLAARRAADLPVENMGWTADAIPLRQYFADRGNGRRTLVALLAAAALLLVLAAINVAALLVARVIARQAEFAVRLAMGGSRARLVRQLLAEGAVIAVISGLVGFAVATATFQLLLGVLPRMATFRTGPLRLDWVVFLFAFGAAFASATLFSALAVPGSDQDASYTTLRSGSRAAGGSRAQRQAHRLLVGAQVGLALILVSCAGLLIESIRQLHADRLGFRWQSVVTMTSCCLAESAYPAQRDVARFHARAMQALRGVPDVVDASDVSGNTALPLPPTGSAAPMDVRDAPASHAADAPTADMMFVESHYFQAMGIRIQRGTTFAGADDNGELPPVIVSRKLAERAWPGIDPIGREVRPASGDGSGAWHVVVGVVDDVKARGVGTEFAPTIYLSAYREPVRYVTYLVRLKNASPTTAQLGALKAALWSVDADLPIDNIHTLEEALGAPLATVRFTMLLLGGFGVLALLVASVGVYGVASQAVARRTREMGIRLALGAVPGNVLLLVVRDALGVALGGVLAGVPLAVATMYAIRALAYGARPADLKLIVLPALLLLLVTAIACLLPARRASRVDPTVALRS